MGEELERGAGARVGGGVERLEAAVYTLCVDDCSLLYVNDGWGG